MAVAADPFDYERALRALLWRYQPRRLQRGVESLMQRAGAPPRAGADQPAALQTIYADTRRRTIEYLLRRREQRRSASGAAVRGSRSAARARALLEHTIPPQPVRSSADFHCDGGLGRVARWLRAAGYDARFWPKIDDRELVRQTLDSSAILLTTDGPLMRRGAVTWGAIPALFVPLNLPRNGQYEFVVRRLGLPRKPPRCMVCGGALATVGKESVRDRIPARTYPWLDDYFECQRCGQLFWPGTHWRSVTQRLERKSDG